MSWIVHLIVLALVCIVTGKDCVIDNRSRQNTWEAQLQKDIITFNDIEAPNSNETEVYVKFILKYFSFDAKEEIFKVHSWMMLAWTDERLKWDKTKYDGITETIALSNTIWSPGLRLVNEVDWDEFEPYYGQCTIQNMGFVFCIPRMVHGVLCNTKLINWPFDIQKCTLKFGASTKYCKVKFTFSSRRAVAMMGAEYGADWTIIDYEQAEYENQDTQLSLTFYLERQAVGLAAIVIMPIILLSMLTLSALLLEVKDYVRLGIISFSLLWHFYYLSSINDYIPKHSVDTPSILLYARGSVLVTLIVLTLTTFLSCLMNRKSVPPNWVVSINDLVLKSRGKFIVIPRWEADLKGIAISDDLQRKVIEHWTDFANIINSVFCISLIMFYIICISLYMPRPSLSTNYVNLTDSDAFFMDQF
ncbi:acetylcholine receptor subunit beta-type acr-3-like [Galleria mellonella]|uniref:Acetylcholine receptor subunit beta-type acr-3-like n=1 Tax=Galleria mellonella TaxID=7137 RepID=A0A6J1W7K7_GALME|nr:acetylcholine receptor subunit beta-type acr-3-like [Galleria mellonella]